MGRSRRTLVLAGSLVAACSIWIVAPGPVMAQSPAQASLVAGSGCDATSMAAVSPASGSGVARETLSWSLVAGGPMLADSTLHDIAAGPSGNSAIVGYAGAFDMDLGRPINAFAGCSGDGASWVAGTVEDGRNADMNAVAASADGFVAVGGASKGLVWTSSAGDRWSPVETPLLDAAYPQDVSWSPAVGFVATGVRETIDAAGELTAQTASYWLSADGQTWTSGAISDAAPIADLVAVGDDGLLLAAGRLYADDGPSSPVVWRSSDGASWEAIGGPATTGAWYPSELAFAAGRFFLLVAHDSDGTIPLVTALWSSTDGTTWDEVPGFESFQGAIGAGGPGVVAVDAATVRTSADGTTWTSTPETLFDGHDIASLAGVSDGRVLVVGKGTVPSEAEVSDGAVWVGTPE